MRAGNGIKARVAGIQTSNAVWMTALLFVLALLLAPPVEAAKRN